MFRKLLTYSCSLVATLALAEPPPGASGLPNSPNSPTEPRAPGATGMPSKPPEGAAPPGKPLVTPAQPPPSAPIAPPDVKADEPPRAVRVNVTNQPWDFSRPWGKRPPYTRRAIGAVLPGGRVLVSAELVANANYLEFEMPEGGSKTPASVEVVDYECNLALLKGDDPKFLNAFQPFELTEAKAGDTLSIWQLESTGVVLATQGPMTTAEVSRYPTDESSFLVYRATASLQFRDSSFNLPVVKDGKLVGLVVRYDNGQNSAEIVPSPVIEHFIKDAEQRPYEGFPRTGILYSNTRDPQLRHYVGLDGKQSGGVYVTDLSKDGPGEEAGIQKGDILLSVDGQAIDQDGNYVDPKYGKLSLIHLVSTRHFHGDPLKITLFRKGETKEVQVKIAHREVESYAIEPYVIDRAPKFFILGGLVLQELSRQYLKEFGQDWLKRAPEELVYLDRYQSELLKDGPKKVVILSKVLPMPTTLGYEELHHLVVKKINGVVLQSLADVPAALGKAEGGLHKIEFDTDPSIIFLDAAALSSEEAALVRNYRLPATKRLVD
jgi:PDZ domain